jgi:hypothetical protein
MLQIHEIINKIIEINILNGIKEIFFWGDSMRCNRTVLLLPMLIKVIFMLRCIFQGVIKLVNIVIDAIKKCLDPK